MPLNDTLHLLRAWLRDPRSVGALAPSGPALARLMTAHVDHAHGPVIELGPGTGVFTRALLERGLPGHRLVLVETDPVLASTLAQRYPHARVLRMDAARLGRSSPLFGDERASAVISGLPLLNMPRHAILAIITGAFSHMRPGAAFYQFTYGPRCPVPRRLLDRLGLKATYLGRTLRNLPPAAVYRIARRPSVTPCGR